ncbi:MAG: GDP-L-fucose synthase [Deltaproteobacteria bacterium]|nr:GDP-L-fucose synthase [Deltaproteobacteria bacterium]
MEKKAKIYIAGHKGLVGSAIVRKLQSEGYKNLLFGERKKTDLTRQGDVEYFFRKEKPDYVFLAAAKVGGILANNSYPADFIRDNLLIQNNVIESAYKNNVKKLLFPGSSCIYPKHAPQPLKESSLLSGPLEPTNEWYAIAKIAGIKMCQAYRKQYGFNAISVMPTNLYGPGDNFDLETSHVLPALMRKFHEAVEKGAKEVTIWGTGNPRREFLHVDDLADALLFLMKNYESEKIINVGTGSDISIRELAQLVKNITGFQGNLIFDSAKPDGTPKKLLDNSYISSLGWQAKIPLKEGIKSTYDWYRQNCN